MIDVIGGQAHTHVAVSVPALPFLRSGQLKGLAVGLPQRSELVPDIPTLDEMRKIIPAEITKWTKVAIDAGMPREVK